MTTDGTVIATHRSGRRPRCCGQSATWGRPVTDNTVTYDHDAPEVTINQAGGQADPTSTSPINFTVVFDESGHRL